MSLKALNNVIEEALTLSKTLEKILEGDMANMTGSITNKLIEAEVLLKVIDIQVSNISGIVRRKG